MASKNKSVLIKIASPLGEDGCGWMRIGQAIEWGNVEHFRQFYLAEGYAVKVITDSRSVRNWNKKPDMNVIRKMVRDAITFVRRGRRRKSKEVKVV